MQRSDSFMANRPRRYAVAVAAALGCAAAPALADDVAPFTVHVPSVTGPIASTASNFAMGVEGFDIMPPVPKGYVVEEFFVSGVGNIYEYTPTGIRVVSPCPPAATAGCTNVAYTTRIVVKRPKDRHDFSGTVVVEALNPSGGFDIAAVWDRSREQFVRNGDIFVGWSSKSVIINALKNFNPTRYAQLNWPYLPATPGSNSGAEDGITFDIAAQMGALVRDTHSRGNPLHGFDVRHVIESGFSQDGSFTFTQADIFNAIERLPGGRPVYDGYIPMGTNGPSNINFGLTKAGALPVGDKRVQMQPRDVPVIQIDTETEIAIGTLVPNGLAFQRPDGDARDDRYRLWEVPGASHVSNDLGDPVTTLQLDSAQIVHLTAAQLPPSGCAHQLFQLGPSVGVAGVVDPNDFPFSNVQNAAFVRMLEWIEFDRKPPHADFITVDTSGKAPVIVRDANGNAEGGVRTPFVDVPVTAFTPIDTVAHPTAISGFCILDGFNTPFSDAQLDAMYKNHGEFVEQFARESVRLVREGFWLVPDAIKAVEKAARSHVP